MIKKWIELKETQDRQGHYMMNNKEFLPLIDAQSKWINSVARMNER